MTEETSSLTNKIIAGTSSVPRTAEVAGIALSMRIPPFWRDRPRLWFITFEAATHDLKKGQRELSQMVIAQLDRQDIEQISDLLYNPPEAEQYNALKNRLISVYEESEGRQFQKLLSEMELGDQKPTQLLRRMRDLAREKVPEQTLRLMWMNHLPAHVRSVLVVSDTISKTCALDELALLADKMLEQTHDVAAVSLLPQPPQERSQQKETQFLVEEIRRLSLEVAALRSRPFHRAGYSMQNRRMYRSRSNQRSRSRSRSISSSTYCYYHNRFGSSARNCRPPCTFNISSRREEKTETNHKDASLN